jgi:hypothetical protein
MSKVIANILTGFFAMWLFSGCDPGGNNEMTAVTLDTSVI